jgi:YVTN family beta-propeller protein
MKKISTIFFLLLVMMGMNAQTAYIANANDYTISVINIATHTVTATINVGDTPFGVSASPDGNTVYVSNYFGWTVSVINTGSNTVTATISYGGPSRGLVVSPDGAKLYVANDNINTVTVINTITNAVTATINVGLSPFGIAVSPDGSKVYVTNSNSNSVSVINTSTNTVIDTIPVSSLPTGITVSPDGTKIYVSNSGAATVSVIDANNNTVSATINVGSQPEGIVETPDGTRLYVANRSSNYVSVINTSNNTVITTINTGANPYGISITKDGSTVYTSNQSSNTTSVINTGTNTVTNTINVGNLPIAFGNFISIYPATCSANFFLYPDTSVQHHYYIINYATGVQPLHYLWSWGDGNTDTIAYPSHTYLDSGVYTICLSITDSTGCTSTFCDSSYHIMRTSNYMVTVNIISNIMTATKTETDNNAISVYPNPATNSLTLNSQLSILNSQLLITDVFGRTVCHQSITNSQTTIDISQLSNGVYFYQVIGGKETVRGKFVKK